MTSSPLSPFRRLRSIFSLERTDIWVVVIYSAAIGLLTLALPIATQALVNTIAFGNLIQPLLVLTLILAVVLLIAAVFQGLRVWVVEVMQRRIFVRLSSETINRLIYARMEAYDHHHGPELVNRFFDVVTLQKSGATLLIDGLTVVTTTIIGMVLLGIYHPWLLAFDFVLLAFILVVIFPLGSGAVPTAISESRAKYSLVAWLQEVARHITTFKQPAGAVLAFDRSDSLVREYLTHRARHFRILIRQIMGALSLQAMARAGLLGIGGVLVINRQLTLGQLVAAELVVDLAVSSFAKLGKHLEIYYDLLAAIDKLGYLQDIPLEPGGTETLPANGRPASARLTDVTFGYSSTPLLAGIDLEIKPGIRLGLTGHSGNGKSSILDLLYGLREPLRGGVEVDGLDLREISRAELRRHVTMVRSSEVFEGTILDNARLGAADLPVAQVREVLARIGLLDEILVLPQGLETELKTGGRPLSEGQAVRLMFARAILGGPRLLLVDEALDHLSDAPSRDALLHALFAPEAPWTLLVASSQPDILRRCDAVLEIRNSRLERV